MFCQLGLTILFDQCRNQIFLFWNSSKKVGFFSFSGAFPVEIFSLPYEWVFVFIYNHFGGFC